MPETIQCPKCSQKLRVPENLLGKDVACPKCGTNFVAVFPEQPVAEQYGIVETPEREVRQTPILSDPDAVQELVEEDEFEQEPQPKRKGPRDRAFSHVSMPAIFLIIMASLQIIGAGVFLAAYSFSKQDAALVAPPNMPADQKEIYLMSARIGQKMPAICCALSIPVNILVLIGAICMLRLQAYGMAMTGAILSCVPCVSSCCVLGIPFGIWALIVLGKPEVKAGFG